MFLDAGNDVLLKRYKETRRQHPLGGAGHIDRGIAKEREEIAFLKIRATFILDTSKMLTRELRVELEKIFVKGNDFKNLYITVMSFGFKYGIPQDADLVFDVRFLPNPYYIEELRAKTGNEAEVRDYVMKSDKAQEFFRQLSQMMDFLIPNYILEGKNQLVVAVGCTGGKHRSVTLANALYQYLEVRENYIQHTSSDYASGYDCMKRIMACPKSPTAVFCSDDAIASYAVRAALDSGLRIPRDVSIIGFDRQAILPDCYRGPAITSVEQPLYTIGLDSVRMLSLRLAGQGQQEPATKVYKTRLVIQQTVGPCGG